MRISRFLPALAASAVLLAACGAKSAAADDAAFDARVHAYLQAHPEVVQEALDKLQAKAEAEAAAQIKQAIAKNRQAIEHDARDFVANPSGKITVTEFYDYRCPHCIDAAPAVLELIKANPDVRFVFKEFPIFGDESDRAATGALAVKHGGGDYLDLYHAFMAARPLNDVAIGKILAEHGVTVAALTDPAFQVQSKSQLTQTRDLAIGIGIQGTPAFIIGDTLVPGADMDAVKKAIAEARKAQKG